MNYRHPCLRKVYTLWARRSDWISGCVASLFIGGEHCAKQHKAGSLQVSLVDLIYDGVNSMQLDKLQNYSIYLGCLKQAWFANLWSNVFHYFKLNYEASFGTRFDGILNLIDFGVTRFDEWRMWGPVITDPEVVFVFDEDKCLELLTPGNLNCPCIIQQLQDYTHPGLQILQFNIWVASLG